MNFMETRTSDERINDEEYQRTNAGIEDISWAGHTLDDGIGIGDGWIGEGEEAMERNDQHARLSSISLSGNDIGWCDIRRSMLVVAGCSQYNLPRKTVERSGWLHLRCPAYPLQISCRVISGPWSCRRYRIATILIFGFEGEIGKMMSPFSAFETIFMSSADSRF